MPRTLSVRYLFNHQCPSHEQGRILLTQAAERAGVELDVEVIEVVDDEQAGALRFYGSPTFVIEGTDPFEPPEGVPIAAEACRAYHRSDGRMAPLPSVEDLAAALTHESQNQGAPT